MGTERIFSFFFCFEHTVFNSLKIRISTMFYVGMLNPDLQKKTLVHENYQDLWNPQF